MSKSFIDLLFILLCGTIVLLSQSLHIGAVKTAPAKIGSGGISEFNADSIVVLAVHGEYFEISSLDIEEPVKVNEIDEIKSYVSLGICIVLVAADESISHHRIMESWDQCREVGFDVKLAATQKKKDG